MPGLLSLDDPMTQLGGLLMAGSSPFFATNVGNAITQSAALRRQAHLDTRADQQAELQQLVQSYGILKQQDQAEQALAQYDGHSYRRNPLLDLHEQKLSQLLSMGSSSAPMSSGLLSGGSGAPAPMTAPQGAPPSPMSTPPQQGGSAPSIGQPDQQPVSPMQQATLRQAARAANIPDASAITLISQGKVADLIKQINEALGPKNGPAGITRINPVTGQVEILGGNAAPGTVPFIRNAQGQNVAQPIQGAAEEVARAEALKADATNASNAKTELIDVPMGDGRTIKMSKADYLAKIGVTRVPAMQPPQAAMVAPDVQASRDGERVRILQNELLTEMKQPPSTQRDQNIAALRVELGSMGATGGARPNRPAQIGVTQSPTQAAADKALAEGGVKSGLDFLATANANVDEGLKLKQRTDEARALLKDFRPGMGTDLRTNIGRGVASVTNIIPGVSEEAARNAGNFVAGGNTASVQEFQKLAATQAMEALKQAMNSGRITQAEFKIFKDANPSPSMDRQAIERIFNFMDEVSGRDYDKQQFATAYKNKGLDMGSLPAAWSAYLTETGRANLAAKYLAPQPNSAGSQSTGIRKYNPTTGRIE